MLILLTLRVCKHHGKVLVDVRNRVKLEESSLRGHDLLRAFAVLAGECYTNDQSPGRIRILPRDNDDRPELGCETQVGQPHITGSWVHRGGPGLLARPYGT